MFGRERNAIVITPYQGHIQAAHLLNDNFAHLVEVVSVRFPHCKVTLFPLPLFSHLFVVVWTNEYYIFILWVMSQYYFFVFLF